MSVPWFCALIAILVGRGAFGLQALQLRFNHIEEIFEPHAVVEHPNQGGRAEANFFPGLHQPFDGVVNGDFVGFVQAGHENFEGLDGLFCRHGCWTSVAKLEPEE